LSSAQVIRSIWNTEGPAGFMRGLLPTILRESTNSACFFGLSKIVRTPISRVVPDEKIANTFSYLVAGVTAGFLTSPFDLVKTLAQKDITSRPKPLWMLLQHAVNENKGLVFQTVYKGAFSRVILIGSTMTGMGCFSERIPHHLPSIFHIEPVKERELR